MLKNPKFWYGTTDVRVPVRLNFGEAFLKRLSELQDRKLTNAATCESITYGDIIQRGMNLAVSLTQMGVKNADTVGIFSENCLEFWPTVLGVVCTGATLTTINIMYTKDELKHVMSISKPTYIFCSQAVFEKHKKNLRTLSHIKKIIVFGSNRYNNTLLYDDLINANAGSSYLKENVRLEEFQAVDVQGQIDTLFLLYSSGTTGLPKGVMLTHLNLLSMLFSGTFDPKVKLVNQVIAPWFHVMGLIGALLTMCNGNDVVFLPKFERELYLKSVEKYKVNLMTVPPPVLVELTKAPINYDVSSVVAIFSGAAPLYKETSDSVLKMFTNVKKIIQGYGMTESTLAVIRDEFDDTEAKSGGVGRVVSEAIVKVVDIKTREPLGSNQEGEICLKGPMVMKGYVGKDKKEDFDEEGFYKTGDIGYYDDEGVFFIVDRLKELIKYKGYQVAPAEIEAVLLKHEAVRDAGVIGIENKAAGEVPLAFVVTQPTAKVTEKELQDHVAKTLSNPKHLRGGVRFVSQIPRNASGKILRLELRKMAKRNRSKL